MHTNAKKDSPDSLMLIKDRRAMKWFRDNKIWLLAGGTLLGILLFLVIDTQRHVSAGIRAIMNTNRIYRNLDCIGDSVRSYIASNNEIPRNAFEEPSLFYLFSLTGVDHTSIDINCLTCRDESIDLRYAMSHRVATEFLHRQSENEADTSNQIAEEKPRELDDDVLVVYYGDNFSRGSLGDDYFVICHYIIGGNFVKRFESQQERNAWVDKYLSQEY